MINKMLYNTWCTVVSEKLNKFVVKADKIERNDIKIHQENYPKMKMDVSKA